MLLPADVRMFGRPACGRDQASPSGNGPADIRRYRYGNKNFHGCNPVRRTGHLVVQGLWAHR
ncbi:hypothetical protein DESC_790061 [Desulfosarcina cetonica]|nr:hypothetical protein DESC_790061 [Desulfosarcina cetonica]